MCLQRNVCVIAAAVGLCMLTQQVGAQTSPNLNDLTNQLTVPSVEEGTPEPGKRVWQRLEAYQDWKVAHAVYLPVDWKAGERYPVIFEYPGNGGFRNSLGDVSDGSVDGCRLGYGLSQGKGAIWVCLPFVDSKQRRHAVNWWGDADETVRYCLAAIESICEHLGGDRERMILCGFSRGAIATSYIGLRNDKIASQWCGLFAHSHFDGVRSWPYADSDAKSAIERQRRFQGRPQWISHERVSKEMGTRPTMEFLRDSKLLHDKIRFADLPYPNHSADWILKDTALAQEARRWWQECLRSTDETD